MLPRFAPWALVAAALLCGCAALGGTPGAAFPPLPPQSYGGHDRAQQLITFSRGTESATLQAYVEIAPEQLRLVATGALGQRLLTLTQDAAGIHAESALPPALAPEAILTDLQLVCWPAEALRTALGEGWSVLEPAKNTRRVLRGDEPYAEVHYAAGAPWRGRSWLVNWRGRYSLTIDAAAVK